jgi:hypothetical protein
LNELPGVVVTPNVNTGAKIMMVTAVGYVIIQIPGLVYLKSTPEVQAGGVSVFALITLTLCIAFFLGYLYYQFKLSGTNAVEERVREDVMIEAIATVSWDLTVTHVVCNSCALLLLSQTYSLQSSPLLRSAMSSQGIFCSHRL